MQGCGKLTHDDTLLVSTDPIKIKFYYAKRSGQWRIRLYPNRKSGCPSIDGSIRLLKYSPTQPLISFHIAGLPRYMGIPVGYIDEVLVA